MDFTHLDAIARDVARAASRRAVIKAALVALGAAIIGTRPEVASAHTLTVSGKVTCGLAIFGCQDAKLTCGSYSKTTKPDGYSGSYRFTGVPHHTSCSLTRSYFGLKGYRSCTSNFSLQDKSVTFSPRSCV